VVNITLQVERDEANGWYIASWDAPDGSGGITTQGQDMADLQTNVLEAVRCHFDEPERPRTVQLHFVSDPVLDLAVA
jgi:hypothetical protein